MNKKLLRFRQWLAAVKLAAGGNKVSYFHLLWGMAKALRTGRVSKAQWRQRMRYGCMKCPIYDPVRKLCRVEIGTPYLGNFGVIYTEPRILGCGCYTPYLALVRAPYTNKSVLLLSDPPRQVRGCWGRATMGGDFGWGEE